MTSFKNIATLCPRKQNKRENMFKQFIHLYNKIFQFWMQFPQKIRFLLVGGYNTVFSYALYALFIYLYIPAQLALFLSFLLSSLNSYITQKFYVFNTKGNYVKEYLKCLVTWFGSYIINAILLEGLMHFGRLNAYIAEFIALVLITVYSYIALKYFAFKGK